MTDLELKNLKDRLWHSADMLRAAGTVPCTGCKYCVEGCPVQINIPAPLKPEDYARLITVAPGEEAA